MTVNTLRHSDQRKQFAVSRHKKPSFFKPVNSGSVTNTDGLQVKTRSTYEPSPHSPGHKSQLTYHSAQQLSWYFKPGTQGERLPQALGPRFVPTPGDVRPIPLSSARKPNELTLSHTDQWNVREGVIQCQSQRLKRNTL